jgi:hypothetical protein
MQETIAWLREVHERLMAHVRAPTDADMLACGWRTGTRWLLSTLLQHDVYHAGEINRMRSVLSGEDRWQWQIELGIER